MLNIDGYKVSKKLYENKTIVIYHGQRLSDKENVTVKTTFAETPDLKLIAQLKHEYDILKDLNIPGVIKVQDLIFNNKQPILIFEDAGSHSFEKIHMGLNMPLNDFFHIALQLVDILDALHIKHIIHKDIKPANIIFNPEDLTVHLIDFCISSEFSLANQEGLSPDHLEGTLPYMSPEQTGRLNRTVDYRSDLYSLGVTFYELLTGELPFQGKDALEIIYCHLAKTPPSVSDHNPNIPQQLSDIIAKLMAKAPENRYVSASGLKADLLECEKQWNETGTILPFPLGLHGLSEYFSVSKKLYGREKQIDQLLKAFERVSQNTSELVLVSGYSGVGKTSIIKEINKPVVQHRGRFISGKYDQLRHNIPFSAFTQAFEEFIYQLLSESQEKIDRTKERILEALGNNGAVLDEIIPSLKLLLGQQPPVPEFAAVEAQNRLMSTLLNFVRTLAQPEAPLVIFIDDWQWADSVSLRFLHELLGDSSITSLLVIGAYRDNEVPTSHPFALTLDDLKKQEISITTINLLPLLEEDIIHLLADSFNSEENKVIPLAQLLLDKTGGNPFFINVFLMNLYENELLTFSPEHHCWQWDIDTIQQQSFTDNVIDYLSGTLNNLEDKTLDLLKIASCIGHTFDLQTLSWMTQQSPHQVAQQLNEAIKAKLIAPLNDQYLLLEGLVENDPTISSLAKIISYRFMHDRIQQAAYSLSSLDEKEMIHLKMGRLLRDNTPALELSDQIFLDMLNHLNLGSKGIESETEKRQTAEFNLKATLIAGKSNAYDLALDYAQKGLEFLPSDAWQHDNELYFDLHFEVFQNTYLLGKLEEARAMFPLLEEKSKTEDQKVKFYFVMSRIAYLQLEYDEGNTFLIKIIGQFGVHLDSKPSKFSLIKKLIYVKTLLYGKTTDELFNAPEIKDEKILTVLKAMDLIISVSAPLPSLLWPVTMLCVVEITLKHGMSPYAAVGYLGYAMMVQRKSMPSKSEEDIAYNFGQLAIKIMNRYDSKDIKSQHFGFYAIFIHYRRNHLKYCVPYLKEGYLAAIESGTMQFAAFNFHVQCIFAMCLGEYLSESMKIVEKGFQVTQKNNDEPEMLGITMYHHLFTALMSETDIGEWGFKNKSEAEVIEIISTPEGFRGFLGYYYGKLLYCSIMGNITEGIKHINVLKNAWDRDMVQGAFLWITYLLHSPLVLAASYGDLSRKEQHDCLKKIKEFIKILEPRAERNPDNYLNKYMLVKAEYARLTKDIPVAIYCYTQAIAAAKQNGFIQEEAIAHELLGKFYLESKDMGAAYYHLHVAYLKYQTWGAKAKCRQMEKVYSSNIMHYEGFESSGNLDQQTTTSIGMSEESLDLASIIKVSQAISSEIDLNKLLTKLVSVLIESAGAQRGVLMTLQKNEWVVEASSSEKDQQVYITDKPKVNDQEDIPLTLIHYVQRTQQPFIIQHENHSKQTETDPYLMDAKPKSVLVLPLFYQGTLNNIVYMENNVMEGAFTQRHLKTLNFLATQAAISLENARLYYDATHDHMTGLANRNLLERIFVPTLAHSIQKGKFVGIIFADLDYFKNVNDTLGHEIGDKVLIYMAQELKLAVRDSDMVVRLGGDEFVVLLNELDSKEQVIAIADRFYKLLSEPLQIDAHTLQLSSSMGISLYPSGGTDMPTLMKNADIALYKVKEAGKNHYLFFDEQWSEDSR